MYVPNRIRSFSTYVRNKEYLILYASTTMFDNFQFHTQMKNSCPPSGTALKKPKDTILSTVNFKLYLLKVQ
jgi:hypothetical protein